MASTLSLRPNSPTPFLPHKNQLKSPNLNLSSQIPLRKKARIQASTTKEEINNVVEEREEKGREKEFLVREFGWGVRKLQRVGEEIRLAAYVQAEAFHEPVALFNGLFFAFFKAEVLSDLIIRMRNSASDRYACLVAESVSESTSSQEIVGVLDVTVQRDKDVLIHIKDSEEYLYISGIAVLKKFRRKKVATVLLKACDVLSRIWRYKYLALRAYEDDFRAQNLYLNAGYKVVETDPIWTAWIGNRRRVLMIKTNDFHDLDTTDDVL
ncbi:hypothetical protein LUZ60_013718 [Juncus effusus]|nr:hypothetical protein LUZ60_013718 [Juncus effusus]